MSSTMLAAVHEICGLIWAVFCVGGCAWLVFYEGHSGWWFVLAVFLASGWSSKGVRSIMDDRVTEG